MDWLCHQISRKKVIKIPDGSKKISTKSDAKTSLNYEDDFSLHYSLHEANKEQLIVPFLSAATELNMFYEGFVKSSRKYHVVDKNGVAGGKGDDRKKLKFTEILKLNTISELNSKVPLEKYSFYTTISFHLQPNLPGLPFTIALYQPTSSLSKTELEEFVLAQACLRLGLDQSKWITKGKKSNPKKIGDSGRPFRFSAVPKEMVGKMELNEWKDEGGESCKCHFEFVFGNATKTSIFDLSCNKPFNQSLYQTLQTSPTSNTFPLFHQCQILDKDTDGHVSRKEHPKKGRKYKIRMPMELKSNDKPYVRYNIEFVFFDGTSFWFQIRISPCETALDLFRKCLELKKQPSFFCHCTSHVRPVEVLDWNDRVEPYGSYSFVQVRTKDDWWRYLRDLRDV
ncbi:unnamed protein product [Bursaphelenchus xylophilus]|uniref:(pine wood nematode) hypothetical protein n=1 Tax=Bursaphelenchus xylophilus TaxID=6326 RepID=A0A1I7SS39_BURXY|nr:unnamed protein product [Bursaphelenchus xylophilus]CAG9105713.1 unnamed protein product [Bursaphelenchus xylophilus]